MEGCSSRDGVMEVYRFEEGDLGYEEGEGISQKEVYRRLGLEWRHAAEDA